MPILAGSSNGKFVAMKKPLSPVYRIFRRFSLPRTQLHRPRHNGGFPSAAGGLTLRFVTLVEGYNVVRIRSSEDYLFSEFLNQFCSSPSEAVASDLRMLGWWEH